MMRRNDLGVVDTIYEEEDDEDFQCSSSPSLSSPPPESLHSRVSSWSLVTGHEADVFIYVQGKCFNLHKDVLTTKSSYLKRQLTELSKITLPLNITAETFTLVADFCYGTDFALTPFNVVALRTAAELLGMTETKSKAKENLKQITETYFRRVMAGSLEVKQIVVRSCLRLLPEAETAAFLLSRCIEALDWAGDDEEMDGIVDDVLNLDAEEFEIVADAMHCRFSSHDVLYRIVDLYIQQHNGKIAEEQKMEICNFIDCEKLSPHLLLHAVQNPKLPLRFIVRAMLIEQLNTRRELVTATTTTTTTTNPNKTATTLGSILHKDAASRQASKLKAEMATTSSRIQYLEHELAGMKKLLQKSEKERIEMEKKLCRKENSIMREERSASFHYGVREDAAKIEKGERGSTSFASFRNENSPIRAKKSIGMRLISKLKSTLWVSKSQSKTKIDNGDSFRHEYEDLSIDN
ncbi:BTB/POZ domain-containing protein At3g49900-like [Euphorbia lathyris]|uniref:BTB/POZ domain-containing protein At3g49900-like n=1 Tax=Euphorbia lathyris TaxID=212925 RepID=UPI003313FAD7